VEQCGTMQLLKQHLDVDPGLKARMQETEAKAQAWAKSNAKSAAVVTIPTVVHIIYNADSSQYNIPDSVIFSQIDVLNEDFRRMNADAINTRTIFDSIAADVEVQFCLASIDPNGNATDGITRTATNVPTFDFTSMRDSMKFTSSGGQDAWPRDEYLNIWVCDMRVDFFGQLLTLVLGYAQFPGDADSTDGVVIHFTHFGRSAYPYSADTSLGRTTTHEVGHWLGLRHTWADDQDFFGNGTCDSSDFVDDTPNQSGQSKFDCDMVINSCSGEAAYWGLTDPPDMVENFMDYSSDSCSNMFSMGQKTRMWSFLNTDRLPLQSASACVLVGINEIAPSPQIMIFPNPSSGKVKVTILNQREETVIQVFDALGRVVHKSMVTDHIYLELGHLSSGVYLIKGTDSKSSSSSRLIITK